MASKDQDGKQGRVELMICLELAEGRQSSVINVLVIGSNYRSVTSELNTALLIHLKLVLH